MTQDEVDRKFTHYELVEMLIAEEAAPWGESAENLRMMYLKEIMVESSNGYTQETREAAANKSQRILNMLLGPAPAKEPQKTSDFLK